MSGELRLAQTAAQLRAAFDAAFAEPTAPRGTELEGFLVARCDGASYLLALAELGGFAADRRIVALPTRMPRLLGVTGIRGTVTPVYDLATLLGHAPVQGTPKWIAVARGARVAFAFAEFGGHVRSARATWIQGAGPRPTARVNDELHQVIDLAALVADIERDVRASAQSQE